MNVDFCKLCGRFKELHRHHVIPKKIWKRLKRTKRGEYKKPLISLLCIECSRQIHALFSTRKLTRIGHIEKLREYPEVQKYIEWVRKLGNSVPPPPKLCKRIK